MPTFDKLRTDGLVTPLIRGKVRSEDKERTAIDEALIGQFSLAGRVAVVTGAASGIGQETARVLARAGARVALADVDEAGLAATAGSMSEQGGASIVRRVDVSDRAQVDALAEAVMAEAGRIDIWVSAAAILVDRPIVDARDDEVDRILAVNLKSVYWCCGAAARAMKASGHGGGSIINLSSAGAESANPGLSLYSMTKAAVNALTRNAAKEFGPDGIRVNAIAPGWIDTPLANHGFRDETGGIDPEKRTVGLRARAQVSPLGITGVPQDIALAALYLASDASRFMTGQIMRPNGGVSMP